MRMIRTTCFFCFFCIKVVVWTRGLYEYIGPFFPREGNVGKRVKEIYVVFAKTPISEILHFIHSIPVPNPISTLYIYSKCVRKRAE